MPGCHEVVLDEDVLAGHADPPALGIASGLDRDVVVPGVEERVLDDHVPAGLRVHAVIVRAQALQVHAVDGHVLAQHGVQQPHRGVVQRDALHQDVLALVELHEVRPEHVPFAEHPLGDRHPFLTHLEQRLPVLLLQSGARVLPVPPVVRIGIAVEGAVPGHCDVLHLVAVDEWGVVVQLHPLEPGLHYRQVVALVLAEQDRGIVGQMQVDVVLEVDRSGEEGAIRNEHPSAAALAHLRDRRLEGVGALLLPGRVGAEVDDADLEVRELGRLHPVADRIGLLPGGRGVRGIVGRSRSRTIPAGRRNGADHHDGGAHRGREIPPGTLRHADHLLRIRRPTPRAATSLPRQCERSH